MKKNVLFLLMFFLSLVFFISACDKMGSSSSILDEISGVWRAKSDGAMVSIIYAEKKLRMLINDKPIPVSLGEIDKNNKTINLNVTTNEGKPAVWTIRQVWDKENKSFHLVFTLHDGTQDELSFVRKISSDDMNKIANAEAKVQGGPIGASASPTEKPIPQQQTQQSAETSWAPSFDCAKVSTGPERLICSNKELSEADVQLAQVYKAALRSSPDKDGLKRQQGSWLKNERDACSNAESMLKVYKERIAQLSR